MEKQITLDYREYLAILHNNSEAVTSLKKKLEEIEELNKRYELANVRYVYFEITKSKYNNIAHEKLAMSHRPRVVDRTECRVKVEDLETAQIFKDLRDSVAIIKDKYKESNTNLSLKINKLEKDKEQLSRYLEEAQLPWYKKLFK